MNIETLLNEEIESEFECLKELEAGSEEYKVTVDGLTKLVDRAIEIDKLNIEHDEKEDLAKEERKERWIKHGINIASIVIPTLVTIWGTKASFRFEKEGTITTIMGRGFINKLIPKK
jgi:hypothetical protein